MSEENKVPPFMNKMSGDVDKSRENLIIPNLANRSEHIPMLSGGYAVSSHHVSQTPNSLSDHLQHLTAELSQPQLWEMFSNLKNEMIITKKGRRIFPHYDVNLAGMNPNLQYSVIVELQRINNHRYAYQNEAWIIIGKDESQINQSMYVHPSSPSSGQAWMSNTISFQNLKLSNSTEDTGNGVLLVKSLCDYCLRLHVVCCDDHSNLASLPRRTFRFPHTDFITVTCYKNKQIKSLKIKHNPYAKSFGEGGGNSRNITSINNRNIQASNSQTEQHIGGSMEIRHFVQPDATSAIPSHVNDFPNQALSPSGGRTFQQASNISAEPANPQTNFATTGANFLLIDHGFDRSGPSHSTMRPNDLTRSNRPYVLINPLRPPYTQPQRHAPNSHPYLRSTLPWNFNSPNPNAPYNFRQRYQPCTYSRPYSGRTISFGQQQDFQQSLNRGMPNARFRSAIPSSEYILRISHPPTSLPNINYQNLPTGENVPTRSSSNTFNQPGITQSNQQSTTPSNQLNIAHVPTSRYNEAQLGHGLQYPNQR